MRSRCAKPSWAASPGRRTNTQQRGPMLELRDVTKNFGGLRATGQLSFTVERGDFLGVIGPNGAGKTTLLNLITGYIRPSRGDILFEGTPKEVIAHPQVIESYPGKPIEPVTPYA